jgi:molybdopterin synthase catalytic subunit
MIKVTRENFDPGEIIARARQGKVGAVVSFLGIVRDDGIEGMDVEAFEEVAKKDLEDIAFVAEPRVGGVNWASIHRVGYLTVGEPIVLIVVGASHRKAAFLACEYIIDRIKEHVPIWKKEYTHEGARWVQGGH